MGTELESAKLFDATRKVLILFRLWTILVTTNGPDVTKIEIVQQ